MKYQWRLITSKAGVIGAIRQGTEQLNAELKGYMQYRAPLRSWFASSVERQDMESKLAKTGGSQKQDVVGSVGAETT